MDLVKRRPSECGEFETGCHTPESNSLALIATTWPEYASRIIDIVPEWFRAMAEVQAKTLTVDAETLELVSLKWLLATQRDLYADILDTHEFFQRDDEEELEEPPCPEDIDPNITRDWFCWLHREIVGRVKENQLQTNEK